MRRQVFHSLDRPSEVLGIQGRYLYLVLAGAVAALFLSSLALVFSDIQTATVCFIVLMVLLYLTVLFIQSKIPEKDFWKVVLRPLRPGAYIMRPRHVRNIWRGFRTNI